MLVAEVGNIIPWPGFRRGDLGEFILVAVVVFARASRSREGVDCKNELIVGVFGKISTRILHQAID